MPDIHWWSWPKRGKFRESYLPRVALTDFKTSGRLLALEKFPEPVKSWQCLRVLLLTRARWRARTTSEAPLAQPKQALIRRVPGFSAAATPTSRPREKYKANSSPQTKKN